MEVSLWLLMFILVIFGILIVNKVSLFDIAQVNNYIDLILENKGHSLYYGQCIYAQNYVSNVVSTTIAGNGGYGNIDGVGTAASFYYPYGVTLDFSGHTLYVIDQYGYDNSGNNNQYIRKIKLETMEVSTVGFCKF